MTLASPQDESVLRLERIISLIEDIDRLKGNPRARQIAIDRMPQEVDAARKPATTHTH